MILGDETRFVYHLSEGEKKEIDSALKYFRGMSLTQDSRYIILWYTICITAQQVESIDVNRDVFPLPYLGGYLEKARDEVYNGIGFVILRGLDVEPYTSDDLATILLGVSSYVAPVRRVQNQPGSVLGTLVLYPWPPTYMS